MNKTPAIDELTIKINKLLAKDQAIRDDPKSRQNGFWIFTKKARKKIDKISLEITELLADKRKLEGNPVPTQGYSGRKRNK